MTKPIWLLILIAAAFKLADFFFGYDLAYLIGYGAFALLAIVISATFFWLWAMRSTPLALGMAFGWAGAACVMSWWWLFNLLNAPEWMQQNLLLFVFLALYHVGAIMHLEVIGRSFSLSRVATFAPVVVSLLVSVAVAISV